MARVRQILLRCLSHRGARQRMINICRNVRNREKSKRGCAKSAVLFEIPEGGLSIDPIGQEKPLVDELPNLQYSDPPPENQTIREILHIKIVRIAKIKQNRKNKSA